MAKKFILLLLMFGFVYGCGSSNIVKESVNNGDNGSSNPAKTYTVTFYGNGGNGYMESVTVKGGEKIKLPANKFVYEGYDFIGWALNSNYNYVYTDMEEITVESNLSLYAKWVSNGSGGNPTPEEKLIINFNNNGGEGYMDPLKVEKGQSVKLTKNLYSRYGYKFIGWSKIKDGIKDYDDEETIAVNENIDLYAVWQSKSNYKITYNSNNGKNESKTITRYPPEAGGKIYLDKNEYTNGNKKFVGWSDKADGNVIYQDEAPLTSLTTNLNLYAVWSETPIVISFDPKGGTGKMEDIYALPGTTVYLPEATYYKEGYLLKGAYMCTEISLYPLSFGMPIEVGNENIILATLWTELPKEPDPVFGGNSKIYKNEYVYLKGVSVKEEDWIESLSPNLYFAVRRADSGWYDITQQYQGLWKNMCWAATSSNLLHWWHDINKANVEKYFNEYAPVDAPRPDTTYLGWGKSNIFDYYVLRWPDGANHPDKALEWYLRNTFNIEEDGGFYKDVFGEDVKLVEAYSGVTQYSFNVNIERALQNDMGIIVSEKNLFGYHVITIWGVHYDENGFVDKLIYADSSTETGNNAPKNKETGLAEVEVKYNRETGKVTYKTYSGGEIPLNNLTLLSSAQKEWKEYFETHEPRK